MTEKHLRAMVICLPGQPVDMPKNTNGNRKTARQSHSGYSPTTPMLWIRMGFGMQGGVWEVVVSFIFHQNLLRGFAAVGVESCFSLVILLTERLVLSYIGCK